ncbi:hypothetical protein ABZ746_26920 [Streptomyces sp. NPDC020096]
MVSKVHRSAATAVLGVGLVLTAVSPASAAGPLGTGSAGGRHCGLPLAHQALSDSIASRDSLTGLCDAIHTNVAP